MLSTINFFTIFNLVALSLLMGVRRVNTLSNKVLAAVIFVPAMPFALNYLSFEKLIDNYPYFVFFNTGYLWAPLILWYIFLMLKITVSINYKTVLLHLIPTFIYIVYWIFVFSQGKSYSDRLFVDMTNNVFPMEMQLVNAMLLLQTTVYLSVGGYKIYNYRFTETDAELMFVKVRWLKQFIILLCALNVIAVALYFLFPPEKVDYIYIPVLYDCFYFLVVYKSFSHSGIFSDFTYNINIKEEIVTKERYSYSHLKTEQSNVYRQKLLDYFEAEEPYLDTDLSLTDLAIQLNISQHHLSQVINQAFDKNFFDFVNSYRIEKAKQMMKDPKTFNLKLEAIGFESGFGSAAAFYRAFKKHTGITPSTFLRSCQDDDNISITSGKAS